ncbi:MAG: PEP-CTERM sorting domain-containing protein [Planctomycetota bacterium]|nr:PEP-CTERM sorting domain-containing protein [Planctomycetota bacterium]
MKKVRMTICLVVAVLALAPVAQAEDFVLTGNQHLDVINDINGDGRLYDTSTVNVLSTGYIQGGLLAYDSSTVNISGGYIQCDHHLGVQACDSSTVNMSGGVIAEHMSISGSSTLNMSGGHMPELGVSGGTLNISGGYIHSTLCIYGGGGNNNIVNISGGYIYDIRYMVNSGSGSSIVNISGGVIDNILPSTTSQSNAATFIFDGYDFALSEGLSWGIDGQTILGKGLLTGKWFDGTSFSTVCYPEDSTVTIMAIPEPATLLLLGLGAAMLKRRR